MRIKMLINIKMEAEEVVDMLVNRLVDYWKPEQDVVELFAKMYENYAENGTFENMEEFDPMDIVDNDYVNYCEIIEEGDEDYEKIKSLYEKDGCCDISCETSYGFIEATNEDLTKFLVRCR